MADTEAQEIIFKIIIDKRALALYIFLIDGSKAIANADARQTTWEAVYDSAI